MSVPMKPGDPAFWMLEKGKRLQQDGYAGDLFTPEWITPKAAHRDGCYICEDPEFALMGLPLCYFCPSCKTGHIAADNTVCDDCGREAGPE